MRFGSGIALSQQFRGQFRHYVAVFSVHQRDAAQFGEALERGIHLVVVDHQCALVGHEMLEGGDAFLLDHGLHLVEDLLAPPSHRHVVGIIAVRPARLVVPHLQRVMQTLALARQREIDDHGGAARQRGTCAGFEIIRRIGAHERHFQMRVRVDPAGHHVAAGGVEGLVAFEVWTNFRDLAAVY